jgi:hypothetical protein
LELFQLFPEFGANKQMSIPKKLLKWATLLPAAAPPAGPKELYRPLELLYCPLEPEAGGKVLLYRPPEPRKRAFKEEMTSSI